MFDPEQAACALALPDGVEAVSMLTLGYPADEIADAAKREARRIPLERFLDVRA